MATEREQRRQELLAAGASPQAVEQAVSLIPQQNETPVAPNVQEPGSIGVDDTNQTGATPVNIQQPPAESVPSVQEIISAYQQNTPTQERQDDLTTSLSDLTNQLVGETDFRAQQQERFNIEQKEQTLNDLTNQLHDLQTVEKQIPLQVQEEFEGRGATAGGVEPIEAGRLRKNAIRALGVSASLQAAQGNLATAQQQVDRAVEAEFGPVRDRIEALQTNLKLLEPQLNREEQRRAEALQATLSERGRLLDQQEQERREILNIANQAAQAGADGATLNRIRNANTQEEALQIATEAGVFEEQNTFTTQDVGGQLVEFELNPQGQVVGQRVLRSTIEPDTGDSEPGSTLSVPDEFSSVVNQAAGLAGAEDQRENTREIIGNALARGEYTRAYSQIANNVEESLTGTVKTDFANARTDIGVMQGMKQAIEEYVEAGGDTGLLKGKVEDIAATFGQLANSDDPEFAALGAQLQREFQSYRNNMTGAAFSKGESREYEKVNPTTDKSLDLNLAVMEGALNQLENRITSTIEQRVPGAKQIYDRAVAGGSEVEEVEWEDIETLPIGQQFKVGSTVYEKVGEDEYIEIK